METNIDWERTSRALGTSVIIGTYRPHPAMDFIIHKRLCHWDEELGDVWEVSYSIQCEVKWLNTSRTFNQKDEVISYLSHITDLLPQFLDLIGKCDKLSERITPLRRKQFKYEERILKLLDSNSFTLTRSEASE